MSKYTYGFLVNEELWADCDSVVARIKAREDEASHPINGSVLDDGPLVDSLEIRVWLGSSGDYICRLEPRYVDLSYVDERLAKRAYDTMRKINKQLRKDNASEPGDVLMSVAKAIGATWYARPIGKHIGRGFYSDGLWTFDDLTDARNEFRRGVEKLKSKLIKKEDEAA